MNSKNKIAESKDVGAGDQSANDESVSAESSRVGETSSESQASPIVGDTSGPTPKIAMPVEPDVKTATSGEILKFLSATGAARKAIRKAEDAARSAQRKVQDAADNEVDKSWRAILRLRLAEENRAKALTPAAPQLPLE